VGTPGIGIESLRAEAAVEQEDDADDAAEAEEEEFEEEDLEDEFTLLCHALKWLQLRDDPSVQRRLRRFTSKASPMLFCCAWLRPQRGHPR